MKKEMVAMLLAGGQGSRLGILTDRVAKPAIAFGAKYCIIDFPLSNCINSEVDTVGVLTQYQPLRLNTHIGVGISWDLDKAEGGVTVLPPYESSGTSEWYSGTANAIYQNIDYIENYDPEYVLILSGDHIYKMDYQRLLNFHKNKNADVTLACIQVSLEEATRFGMVIADGNGRVLDFEEKPAHPRSTLASMGIYIFTWSKLKEYLEALKAQPGCDFGKHILPYAKKNGDRLFAYCFDGFWKDVGTLQSYWETNMGLADLVPKFNLYEEFWPIYTNTAAINPSYISDTAHVDSSLLADGCEIEGTVVHSVIGEGTQIGKGAVIRDSVVMRNVTIGEGAEIYKSILADGVTIGDHAKLGIGEEAPNKYRADIYNNGITVIGENSVIPSGVSIGKNTAVYGNTTPEDYKDGVLASGEYLVKEA